MHLFIYNTLKLVWKSTSTPKIDRKLTSTSEIRHTLSLATSNRPTHSKNSSLPTIDRQEVQSSNAKRNSAVSAAAQTSKEIREAKVREKRDENERIPVHPCAMGKGRDCGATHSRNEVVQDTAG